MQEKKDGASEYGAVQRLYARHATAYDRLWSRYHEVTLKAALEAAPWGQWTRVLNLGCGTGLFEEALARRHPATVVVGLDVTQQMLREAKAKSGDSSSTFFLNALAEELPFASAQFDAVVCANAFHHFRRPARVLQEARRVLCPGGWLVLVDWCDDYLTCKLFDCWLRLVDRAHFRTYGLRDCAEMLTAAGFRVESPRRFKVDWFWGLMALRARV